MTTTPGPRTEAGKRLLAVWLEGRTHPPSTQRRLDFEELVLAIEAEARADVDGLVARVAELEAALQDFVTAYSDRESDWSYLKAVNKAIHLLAGDKAEAPDGT